MCYKRPISAFLAYSFTFIFWIQCDTVTYATSTVSQMDTVRYSLFRRTHCIGLYHRWIQCDTVCSDGRTVSDCITPRSSFYIMKSFSSALVFSSSSVNYTHILTSPLRIVPTSIQPIVIVTFRPLISLSNSPTLQRS